MEKGKNAFHAPLFTVDTERQTYSCRHTNPIICSRHNLPDGTRGVKLDWYANNKSKARDVVDT